MAYHIGQDVLCINRFTEESFRAIVYTILKREKSMIVKRGHYERICIRPKTFEVRPIGV